MRYHLLKNEQEVDIQMLEQRGVSGKESKRMSADIFKSIDDLARMWKSGSSIVNLLSHGRVRC